jgi:hypothetical protein
MKLILQQLGIDLHDLQGVADILGDAKVFLLNRCLTNLIDLTVYF